MDQKKLGPNGDVRNAILPLERPDVKINAGFTEVHEWERMAQERSGANKTVLGNGDNMSGANRTLGGQQILKKTAGEKFACIAMLVISSATSDIFSHLFAPVLAAVFTR
jgi:hypothetical protein